MNLEIAYSVLMNLRLHNNIHVCILKLKFNNISATFIIRLHVQSLYIAFMLLIFTIYSHQYIRY